MAEKHKGHLYTLNAFDLYLVYMSLFFALLQKEMFGHIPRAREDLLLIEKF